MTRIFFDTEFTGLRQNTTLISIGLIAETGERFLGEFTDYDTDQVDNWIRDNVISKLRLTGQEASHDYPKTMLIKGTTEQIADSLSLWLEQFDKVEMWSDCLAYDWVLFCELFGGAFGIPKNIYYIPFDICTLFKLKGIDPDLNREEFAFSGASVSDGKDNKHSALYDAAVIKECYQKLSSL